MVSIVSKLTSAVSGIFQRDKLKVLSVDEIGAYTGTDLYNFAQYTNFDGDKFPGGFGPTALQYIDYWSLRHRSAQLFNENLYARGLIRRLITSVVHNGLVLESEPMGDVLGMTPEEVAAYSENIENRFTLYANSPQLVDYQGRLTFGQLQQAVRLEAMVCGDVLVVLRRSRSTGLPQIQLISGNFVQTPLGDYVNNNTIQDGVELDSRGRHVAFHVMQRDGTYERIPAVGGRSGRTIAWLHYGSDKRHGEVRGQPLLALILQSLKEVDRYRDSVQRKAVINSMLAVFIKKNEDKPGSRPLTAGALRKDNAVVNGVNNRPRRFKMTDQNPGLTIETLQHGEEPVGFNSAGIDLSFGPFEEAIINAVAWANEIPPEVLRLSFSSNYSASQAGINQFKIYISRERRTIGNTFCQPIFIDWKISENLSGKQRNGAFLAAWRNVQRYDEFAAWTQADWSGAVMLSSDMLKQARGYGELADRGWITQARATAELTGMKYSRVVAQLRRENQQLMDAREPIRDAEQQTRSADRFGEGGEQQALVIAKAVATEMELAENE